jgi:hypothetical protein
LLGHRARPVVVTIDRGHDPGRIIRHDDIAEDESMISRKDRRHPREQVSLPSS